MAKGKGGRVDGKLFRKLARADISIVEGLSSDIPAAIALGDLDFVRFGAELLLDTMRGFSHLIDLYFVSSDRQKMSGPVEDKGKSWWEESPSGIVENLKFAVRFYEATINTLKFQADSLDEDIARDIDSERVRLERKLAFVVQIGKKTIERDDPTFWNEEHEVMFRKWLEYRLSR